MSRHSNASINQGHNAAFLIEMVAIVLLLFVIMGIAIHIFTGATLNIHNSSHRNAAISQATLIAESFERSESEEAFSRAIGGTLDTKTHTITTQPKAINPNCSVMLQTRIDIKSTSTETGSLAEATITVTDSKSGEVFYSLQSSHFVSDRGGEML